MRRASAVAAGIAIGIAASLIALPALSTAPSIVRPTEVPSPQAAIPSLACDQKLNVALPPRLEPVTSAWASDGARLLVGARVWYRMGSYVPDEQRVLVLETASLDVRDVARGMNPVWSPDGTRIAVLDPPAKWDDPVSEIVVYDTSSARETARIAGANTRLAFGWRGDELLFWRGSELHAWRGGAATTLILDLPAARGRNDFLARYSGDGERATFVAPAYGRPLREAYVLDTRSGAAERLVGAWRADPAPRGHALFVSYLDHRELRIEGGRVLSVPLPLTGGALLWSPDGRSPLLTPNVFAGFASGAVPPRLFDAGELESFEGSALTIGVPALNLYAALNASGELFAAVRPGGRGPSSLELHRCHATDARPAPTTVTVYYGESSFEPWAAKRDGSAPAGWEALAKRDLEMIGLHPLDIGRVRTLETHILCSEPKCPNGFGLRVVLPYADRDRAYSRCFREPAPDTFAMDAAISAYQCVPLYAPS